jgi:acid phosphatase (class A)
MTRRAFFPWLIILLGLAAPLARAQTLEEKATPAVARFLQPEAVDWKSLLPPPPAPGSIAAWGDLETVLQVQAERTAADVAWAKLVEQDKVFDDYATVLGSWFEAKNLPVLADFLTQVTTDSWLTGNRMKNLYPRQRPPAVDAAVQPVVKIPHSNSYPSGHSLRAYVWAAVLGDVFPERQAELFTQARKVAWGRVIGGVHFPTDTIGGRVAAQAIVAELRKSPAYQALLEKCRAEVAPFLLKKAA